MNLFEKFLSEAVSDTEPFEKRSVAILDHYERCNTMEKAAINELFISMCGFETLYEKLDQLLSVRQDFIALRRTINVYQK